MMLAAIIVFGPRLKGCHIFDEEPQGLGSRAA